MVQPFLFLFLKELIGFSLKSLELAFIYVVIDTNLIFSLHGLAIFVKAKQFYN